MTSLERQLSLENKQLKDELKKNIDEIQTLKEAIAQCLKKIEQLEAEINRLRNRPKRPKLKPSLIGKFEKQSPKNREKNRKKEPKDLKIHKTITLTPEDLPEGSVFLWHRDYDFQHLHIETRNMRYRREVYKTPDGRIVYAPLPAEVKGHFSPELRTLIVYFKNSMHASEGDISSFLSNHGIQISPSQISRISNQGHEEFHKEKQDILKTGLQVSNHIVVDDTGLRQKGKNGYCTHIGNEHFAFFYSSLSKSRLNFLRILRGEYTDYSLNEASLEYLNSRGFPKEKHLLLKRLTGITYADEGAWSGVLKRLGIREEHHVRLAYEAGLMGSIMRHGLSNIVIVSDAAGNVTGRDNVGGLAGYVQGGNILGKIILRVPTAQMA